MVIQMTAITQEARGPEVEFDCPACNTRKAKGNTTESTEQLNLFFFIPIMKLRNTYVTCMNCKAKLACRAPLARLAEMPPEEITGAVRYGASGVGKLLAVLALLTCLIPFAGLLVSGIAAFINKGTKGWAVALSLLGVILGAVSSLGTLVVMFAD